MSSGHIATVAHDDSKGRAIRQGLFLRGPSSPTRSPGGVWTPGVFDVYQVSQEASGTLGSCGVS